MSRSSWKGQYVHSSLASKYETAAKTKGRAKTVVFSRGSTVQAAHVGITAHIHSGKRTFAVKLTPGMVGMKFGSFVRTRVASRKRTK